MKKVALILFAIVSVGELTSTLTDFPLLHQVCKPLILLTLTVYYYASQHSKNETVTAMLMLALIFSWGGDVLLMFQHFNANFFIYGLVSFLIAHGLYIFTYRQHRTEDGGNSLQGLQKIRFSLPILLAGTGLVVILYPQLGDLRIPVLIYATVITVMTLNALYRFGRTNTASFAMVFGGAVLFMISDSLLAIDKFLEPISLAGFWIMLTYIGAQFLIVKGLVRH